MKKLLLLFLIALTSAVRLSAASPSFTLESGVRLSTASGISVLNVSTAAYRSYYSLAASTCIYTSQSSDSGLSWASEQFVLSVSTYTNYDSSGTRNPQVIKISDNSYRMIYEGVSASTSSHHYFLSAVSSDAVSWQKELVAGGLSKVAYRVLSTATTIYISNPSIIQTGTSSYRMYYSVNKGASPQRENEVAVGSALSNDSGASWTKDDGYRIALSSGSPVCVRLSDGVYRLYYLDTTGKGILSAFSYNGLDFFSEAETPFSISNGIINDFTVLKASDNTNWRILFTSTGSYAELSSVIDTNIYSCVTSSPLISSISPSQGRVNESAEITITGEIFDSAVTAKLVLGSVEIAPSAFTRVNDLQCRATFNLSGVSAGTYGVKVINSNAAYAQVDSAFAVRYPAGDLSLLDNLMRVWEGVPVKISARTFGSGSLSMKIYTLDGKLVRTLADGEVVAAGTTTKNWDGKNDNGDAVASGVYVVFVKGVELDERKRIVIVR